MPLKVGDPVRVRQSNLFWTGAEGTIDRVIGPGYYSVWFPLDQEVQHFYEAELVKLVDLEKLRSVAIGLGAQATRRTTISHQMADRRRAKEDKGFKGGRS